MESELDMQSKEYSLYTFVTFNIRNLSFEQRIEILGDQSLFELQKKLYCVHNQLKNELSVVNTLDVTESTSSSLSSSFLEETAFFYLEKGLYHLTSTPTNIPSIGLVQEWLKAHNKSYEEKIKSGEEISEKDISTTIVKTKTVSRTPRKRSSSDSIKSTSTSSLIAQESMRLLLEEGEESMEQYLQETNKNNMPLIKDIILLPTTTTLSEECYSMKDTLIEDCHWQIGKYYLYVHWEHCEHFIALVDVTNVSLSDSQCQQYPREVTRAKHYQRSCNICEEMLANFITFHDRLVDLNPCFFCRLVNALFY
jgi:hypothetical protein